MLFIEDEDGSIKESHCTQECSDKLMEQYGANNWYDWSYANWSVKWDASTVNEYNDGNVDFDTPWNTPFLFWEALTDACPEGHWKLYVKAECGYEGLHISIKDGLIILTLHWVQKPYFADEREDGDELAVYWINPRLWDGEENLEAAREKYAELERGNLRGRTARVPQLAPPRRGTAKLRPLWLPTLIPQSCCDLKAIG